MSSQHLLESIKGEVWQISSELDPLLKQLIRLEMATVMLHTNGVMSSKSITRMQALQIGETHSIPEVGITLKNDTAYNIYLYEGTMNHRDLCLEINFSDSAETLSVCFDLSRQNNPFLNLLTKLVHSTSALHHHPNVSDKYAPSCACCQKKQQALREDISSHPLYRIFLTLEQDTALKITHSGLFTHSVHEFQYNEQSAHRGIVYLHAGSQQYSIDLTQIYHLHVKIDIIKGRPHTVLIAYNAHSHNILELSKAGMSALHQWSNELKIASPSV